jgi:DNA-binding response OmpR family regulator
MTRILVVEDEPGIALGLEDDLTLEGYSVEVIHDGAAAAKRARETAFDLLVLDVMLPGKDGFEICRELRRHQVRTPILMLTARAQESEKVLAFETGADDYVTKPFSPRELRARIAALLRRSQVSATPPTSVRIGEADVDFARAEIKRRGQTFPLTPLEFRILQAFIRARGRILTREQLIGEAW